MKKYILGAVIAFGIVVSPVSTHAADLTSSQIQAILGLLSSFGADSATIANVNAALGGAPTTGGTAFCHNFKNDLTVGSTGSGNTDSDVGALKWALRLNATGDGNSGGAGLDTAGVFTENDAASVVQFQAKYGIPQTGYVGPETRAKLNSLYGCSNQSTQPTITVLTPSQGAVNTNVTIYGTNLTSGGNPSVKFYSLNGSFSSTVPFVSMYSISDQSITIPVPNIAQGTYQISVGTPQGSSNSLQFTVTATTDGCANGSVYSSTTGELCPATAASTITVTSPNVGEVWQKGTTQNVQYAITNNPINHVIRLKLFTQSGSFVQDIVSPAGAAWWSTGPYGQTGGSLQWTVPTSLSDGSYTIQATDYATDGNTMVSQDSSDNYFTITPPTTTTPTAGISLTQSINTTTSDGTTGQPFTLAWKSSNVTSCSVSKTVNGASPIPVSCYATSTASYGGDNTHFLNGSCQPSPAVIGTHVFTFSCTGPSGSMSQSVTHTVSLSAPTVNLTQSVNTTTSDGTTGQPFTLTWSSTNATSCNVSKVPPSGITGPVACYAADMAPYSDATHLNGSCTPTPVVPGTHTFTFTCNGPGGSMSQSVTHYVVSSQTASVLDAFNGAANSGASQTAVSGAGFSYAWDRDLQIGSPFFADVSALQTALTKEGVYTGDVTGGFYNQTFTAVKAFQQKYDIRVTGYVGSITRAKLNTLY